MPTFRSNSIGPRACFVGKSHHQTIKPHTLLPVWWRDDLVTFPKNLRQVCAGSLEGAAYPLPPAGSIPGAEPPPPRGLQIVGFDTPAGTPTTWRAAFPLCSPACLVPAPVAAHLAPLSQFVRRGVAIRICYGGCLAPFVVRRRLDGDDFESPLFGMWV